MAVRYLGSLAALQRGILTLRRLTAHIVHRKRLFVHLFGVVKHGANIANTILSCHFSCLASRHKKSSIFYVLGVPRQTLENQPVTADGLAREGILHLGTMMPGYQVPWYITEKHLAVW